VDLTLYNVGDVRSQRRQFWKAHFDLAVLKHYLGYFYFRIINSSNSQHFKLLKLIVNILHSYVIIWLHVSLVTCYDEFRWPVSVSISLDSCHCSFCCCCCFYCRSSYREINSVIKWLFFIFTLSILLLCVRWRDALYSAYHMDINISISFLLSKTAMKIFYLISSCRCFVHWIRPYQK
jgi:hypothetical protein